MNHLAGVLPMSRSLVALSVLGLFPCVVVAAPVPKSRPLYFPITVGTRWVYEEQPKAGKTKQRVEVIASVEEKDGATVVSVRSVLDGAGATRHKVAISNKGLFMLENDGDKADPPLCVLKLHAPVGTKWTVNSALSSVTIKGTAAVAEPARIKVPAGTYTAVRVEMAYTVLNEKYHSTIWIAQGIGIVKMVSADETVVLKSFTPGK
jgi:hypothetical protein